MTVRLDSVSRRFGSIVALDKVSIDVPQGAITVLLGPNGAGKTTAIRLITGALDADSGTVEVFGVDPTTSAGEEVRRRCGVVTAKPSLYDRLNGMDNLRYAAELFGLGRGRSADGRIVEAAEQFDIADSLEQEVGGYSTGMKTRLALARAVLHEPELLLLDEPTSGLDPESAAAVLDLIATMTSDGRTVLMCTHLLLEAEGLADEVVVMEAGATVVAGAQADLSARYWPDHIVTISVEQPEDLRWLGTRDGVMSCEFLDGAAKLTLADPALVPILVHELVSRGARLTAVEPYRPSLEDLYFAVRKQTRASSENREANDGEPVRPASLGAAGSDNDETAHLSGAGAKR